MRRRVAQNVIDERFDDRRLGFDVDLYRVGTDVAYESIYTVTFRDASHRFTKEHALDSSPDLEVCPFAHSMQFGGAGA